MFSGVWDSVLYWTHNIPADTCDMYCDQVFPEETSQSYGKWLPSSQVRNQSKLQQMVIILSVKKPVKAMTNGYHSVS